jgi:hypothetical protein
MMKSVAFSLAALLVFAVPARAQSDPLSRCIADGTTGKDRKEMARWVFAALAAHPEIKDLSNVTPSAADEASRKFAAIVPRLLGETCRDEVKAVVATGHVEAVFRSAFENLGRLAMQEITAEADVAAAMSRFEAYLDKQKLKAALGTP